MIWSNILEEANMSSASKMPRNSVHNDGVGPYAIFYCDRCSREYRSQPEVAKTIANDIGRDVMSGFLRKIPLVGGAVADNVVGQDPRYIYALTPGQLESAWNQVRDRFRECPTCCQIVCVSDFDEQSGFCQDDSPRKNEIAESQAEQAGNMVKGFAAAFGLDQAFKQAGDAVKSASASAQAAANQAARCPKDGLLAAAGTKFCPECGTAMIQPVVVSCPKCGAQTKGAKFCPECGTKVETAPVAAVCSNCGAQTKGAKFCPECGTRAG
jgi:ribosomal protein L32